MRDVRTRTEKEEEKKTSSIATIIARSKLRIRKFSRASSTTYARRIHVARTSIKFTDDDKGYRRNRAQRATSIVARSLIKIDSTSRIVSIPFIGRANECD